MAKKEGFLEWLDRMADNTDRVADKARGVGRARDKLHDGLAIVKLHTDIVGALNKLGLRKKG